MGRKRRLRGPTGPQGPIVLGIESGGEHLSVALWRLPEAIGEPAERWRLLESATSHRGHRHADTLLGLVDGALARQGLTPGDLALVGVGRGPGGFTGVRVGLATGIGLGLGLGVPVWPVDSLAVLARNAAGVGGVVVPLFDARKGEVYGSAYRVGAKEAPVRLMPARVGAADTVLTEARAAAGDSPCLVLGAGALVYGCADPVPATWHLASAAEAAWLAATAWEAGQRLGEPPAADPAYVRKSEAEIAEEARRRAQAP